MQTPLLQTKLHIPFNRRELVDRTHLINRLSFHSTRRLTLITAPAGFGKTTLATDWLAAQRKTVAWVSLDENDNDPLRFFRYIITALNRAEGSDFGRAMLDMLESSESVSLQILQVMLVNALVQLQSDLILALDDYHLVHNAEIDDALSFLLNNLPPQLHVVLISRTEPRLPLSKLRAMNQLTELGVLDLRFSLDETRTFLNQTMHLGLADDQIIQLGEKTEGWVTGLQLVALLIQNTPDVAQIIDNIAGDNRLIADYLIDEVLLHLPDHVEQFLLRTSILEQLCTDLCNVITGRQDSQQILETLEKRNLFVIPLDHARDWYRYHHLFAELLVHRLETQYADQLENLHRLAARWFIDHRMYEEAIEHFLQARDFEGATLLLQEKIDDDVLANGRFKIYLHWLERIPDDYLIQYPRLILYQLFQLWEMQDLGEVHQRLAFAEKLLGPLPHDLETLNPEMATYHGILAVIKGVMNCGDFNSQEAANWFAKALQLLPGDVTFWRTLALGATGFCCRVQGDYPRASEYYDQVIEITATSGHVFLSFMYSIAQALVYLAQGKLRNAISACQVPLSLDRSQGQNIPFSGLAYMVTGGAEFLSANLVTAEEHARRGLRLIVQDGDVYYIAESHFILGQILIAKGDKSGALDLMDQMMQMINVATSPEPAVTIARAYQAQARILCGQLADVKDWVANTGRDRLNAEQFPDILGQPYFGIYCTVHESFKSFIEFIDFTLARYQFATGNAQIAINTLDDLLDSIVHESRVFFRSQAYLLKALALQNVGNLDLAIEHVLLALRPIVGEPFLQLFIDQGEVFYDLLQETRESLTCESSVAPEDGAFLAYVEHLLAEIAPAYPARQTSSVFELTPRELEVLAGLAEGVSNSEIADRLGVSQNTIKTHLKRIYSKLGASNRLQAVNKGQTLGLLN